MKLRLNVWQRLGVVLSTLWIAVSAALVVATERFSPSIIYVLSWAPWTAGQVDALRKADAAGDTATAQRIADTLRAEEFLIPAAHALEAAIVPVAVGWLGVYLIIWTVHWVLAGCRSP